MKDIVIVLDNIRSVYNVGSIMRTAECAGIKQILLSGYTPGPENTRLTKTALGAEKRLSIKRTSNPEESIHFLKDQEFSIISVEISPESKHYKQITYPDKLAVVFGHERLGVNQYFIENSDLTVYIPMYGSKESLNVATCAGIVIFNLVD